MFRVAVVACDAPGVALPVAQDHAVLERVEAVLLAKVGEQLHRRLIGPLRRRLGCCPVRTGKAGAAGVFDCSRFAHLDADVGVVPAALAAAAAMPAPVIPGEGLVNVAGVGVNETVNTSPVITCAVPILHENGRFRLGASYAVEHQALNGDLAPRLIAGVIGEVALNNVHCWFSLLPGTAVGAGWVVGGVGAAAAAVIFVVAVLYQAQKTGLAPGESVERRHQRIRDAALLPVNPNHGHGESCYCDKQKGNDDLAVL